MAFCKDKETGILPLGEEEDSPNGDKFSFFGLLPMQLQQTGYWLPAQHLGEAQRERGRFLRSSDLLTLALGMNASYKRKIVYDPIKASNLPRIGLM